MILRPIGGIGNRLRAMMSRLEPGLVVHWPVDWECSFGKWQDAFEPIDGIEIVNVTRKPDDSFDEPCDLETCDPAPGVNYTRRYIMLQPTYDVAHLIHELCRGPAFDAIHIRRTDHRHVVPAGGLTWDHEFQSFCAERKGRRIYLATDNAETQAMYDEPNIIVNRYIETGRALAGHGDHTRHTSLADSVVDMFVCAEAERFMGTRFSSFTDTIEILRGLR